MPAPPLWKASVALEKHESADMASLLELASSPQAVLIVEEPFGPGAVVEALYTEKPDAALLNRLAGRDVSVEPLPHQDWIRLSQEGLPPVRAGRFFVHGAHDKGAVPSGVIALRIEAGLAFGTGHHESTALCLALLTDIAKRRCVWRALDLGCGTGVLAIGGARLGKRRGVAADIDPIAFAVARENATLNDTGPLVRTHVADGVPNATRRRCFDLIAANILAGPLTRLAPQIAHALGPRGMLILSGILRWQENLVLGFYRPHGLVLRERRRDGNWSALLLERPERAG